MVCFWNIWLQILNESMKQVLIFNFFKCNEITNDRLQVRLLYYNAVISKPQPNSNILSRSTVNKLWSNSDLFNGVYDSVHH